MPGGVTVLLLNADGGRVKAVEGGAWGGAATLHHKQIHLRLSNALAWVWLASAGPKGLSHLSVSPGKSLL